MFILIFVVCKSLYIFTYPALFNSCTGTSYMFSMFINKIGKSSCAGRLALLIKTITSGISGGRSPRDSNGITLPIP